MDEKVLKIIDQMDTRMYILSERINIVNKRIKILEEELRESNKLKK